MALKPESLLKLLLIKISEVAIKQQQLKNMIDAKEKNFILCDDMMNYETILFPQILYLLLCRVPPDFCESNCQLIMKELWYVCMYSLNEIFDNTKTV